MCFDMIMDKKTVKLNCVHSRRAVASSAVLRMRSKSTVVEEEKASTRRRGLRATVRRPLCSSKAAATLRKQQQKRLQVVCLVEVVNAERQKATENGYDGAFTHFTHRVPPAMAPANTTQYLMADADDDHQFDFQSTTTSLCPGLYGEDMSPDSVYVSLDNAVDYETCLAFQQQSFEAELALHSC